MEKFEQLLFDLCGRYSFVLFYGLVFLLKIQDFRCGCILEKLQVNIVYRIVDLRVSGILKIR